MSNEELVQQMQAGVDVQNNMQQLWEQNKGYIHKVASRYVQVAGYANEMEDLIQQGYFGLHKAVELYDPSYEGLFITYAAYWINQSILRYVKTTRSTIRLSEWIRPLQRQYKEVMQEFEQTQKRKPTDRELCVALHISQQTLDTMRSGSDREFMVSLSAPIGEDEDGTFEELVSGSSDVESDVLDRLEQRELHKMLDECIDMIPGRQQDVIRKLYWDGKSLSELSEMYYQPKQRIADLRSSALNNLRKPKISRKLKPFLPAKVESIAYRGTVSSFKHTNTSSTEKAALELIERDEARIRKLEQYLEAANKIHREQTHIEK